MTLLLELKFGGNGAPGDGRTCNPIMHVHALELCGSGVITHHAYHAITHFSTHSTPFHAAGYNASYNAGITQKIITQGNSTHNMI